MQVLKVSSVKEAADKVLFLQKLVVGWLTVTVPKAVLEFPMGG